MADKPILVTGAAGKTGRAVLRSLNREGVPVRAFVRRAEQRQTVATLGAGEIVEGDLRSRDRVAEAMKGIAAVYHICPNMHPHELGIGRRIVASALDAGIRRLVYHSVLHPQIEAMPHHWAKMRVEELIFESGLDFTILQPAPYMQNVLGQWRDITKRAVYRVPYGLDTRISMVDLEDVAEAATRVLTEEGHAGATYELSGPDLLDQRQIAEALSRGLGRSVRPETQSPHEWAERARAGGLDERRVDSLLAMFRYYDSFGMTGGWRVLHGVLGRPPVDFDRFVDRVVGESSVAPA
jgi:uncharacterized protein YbjT (DUF2867 family)